MPGRKYEGGSGYRFGFNGQEEEGEIAEGIMSAEYWMYDSRLGRRWNTDPVFHEYESAYACFHNSPISLNDPDGDDPKGGGDKEHVVKKGESLSVIAKQYNTTVDVLRNLNGITDPKSTIYENQKLKVPGETINESSNSSLSTSLPSPESVRTNPTEAVNKLSGKQAAIAAQGYADALITANNCGLLHYFYDNSGEYSDDDLYYYLIGRAAGDATALLQSAYQVSAGTGIATSGLGTGPLAAVITTSGVVVGVHGTGVAVAANMDLVIVGNQLYILYAKSKKRDYDPHTTNQQEQNRNKHENADARRAREQKAADEHYSGTKSRKTEKSNNQKKKENPDYKRLGPKPKKN